MPATTAFPIYHLEFPAPFTALAPSPPACLPWFCLQLPIPCLPAAFANPYWLCTFLLCSCLVFFYLLCLFAFLCLQFYSVSSSYTPTPPCPGGEGHAVVLIWEDGFPFALPMPGRRRRIPDCGDCPLPLEEGRRMILPAQLFYLPVCHPLPACPLPHALPFPNHALPETEGCVITEIHCCPVPAPYSTFTFPSIVPPPACLPLCLCVSTPCLTLEGGPHDLEGPATAVQRLPTPACLWPPGPHATTPAPPLGRTISPCACSDILTCGGRRRRGTVPVLPALGGEGTYVLPCLGREEHTPCPFTCPCNLPIFPSLAPLPCCPCPCLTLTFII